MDSFLRELSEIKKGGNFRDFPPTSGLDFSSNDYLGYAENPQIREGLVDFLSKNNRVGSTGSRLISGNSESIVDLENFLAGLFGAESSLLYGSGYLANLGVCVSLGSHDTEFFSDELNHASWIDGIRLAKCKKSIFRHGDLEQLKTLLLKSSAKRKVVVTESIFSMDGDFASLKEIIEVTDAANAILVVDEAHATGTCGARYLGRLNGLRYDFNRTVSIHTGGKALGASGAFVCGPKSFQSLMLNKARSQIFTTALSPLAVEHLNLAVKFLIRDVNGPSRLQGHIKKTQLLFSQADLKHSGSHIIPIIFGNSDAALKASARLAEEGFNLKAIRFPTVRVGSERMRLTLNVNQTEESLQQVTKLISDCYREYFCYRN